MSLSPLPCKAGRAYGWHFSPFAPHTLIYTLVSALRIVPATNLTLQPYEVISWILLPCLECFATLGKVLGPFQGPQHPLSIPLLISCCIVTAQSSLLRGKCLSHEEDSGCSLAGSAWYLPPGISTVPENQKALSTQLYTKGFSELMHFSSQPLSFLAHISFLGERDHSI